MVSVLFFWDGQKLIEQCVALWYDFGGTKKRNWTAIQFLSISYMAVPQGFGKIHVVLGYPVKQVPSMADCTAFVQLL